MLKGVGLGGSQAPTTKSGLGIDVPGLNIGLGTEEPTTETDSCPQVWYDISKDLKRSFSGCNQLAANAIRFAFHDAGKRSILDRT